jgi:hypothetical protein
VERELKQPFNTFVFEHQIIRGQNIQIHNMSSGSDHTEAIYANGIQ